MAKESQIVVRMDAEDLEFIKTAAKKATDSDRKMSHWVRQVALNAARAVRGEQAWRQYQSDKLKRLTAEIEEQVLNAN